MSRLRATALTEVILVAAFGFASHALLRHFGAGVAGGGLATIMTASLATWLLRRRALGWRDLGCRRPENLRLAAAWTTGLFLAAMLLVPPLVTLLSNTLGLAAQNLSAFGDLPGNLPRYLVLLIPIGWGTAAFGEELIYRGFITHRLAEALGNTKIAETAAMLGQAALFGLAHAYLGPRGMLNAGALGLAFGIVYRLNGRNLWPLFIAHGLVDSVGITAIYFGMVHS
jgi:membrane protease YdiL (CAAX protease family)